MTHSLDVLLTASGKLENRKWPDISTWKMSFIYSYLLLMKTVKQQPIRLDFNVLADDIARRSNVITLRIYDSTLKFIIKVEIAYLFPEHLYSIFSFLFQLTRNL